MRILWNTLEKLDRAVMKVLDQVDGARKLEPVRVRTERQVEHVRAPQRVIEFDR